MKPTNAAATLASVVFLKIQEFARQAGPGTGAPGAQLEAVVAVSSAELALASRIVLDAADGAAVVVLGDPGEPCTLPGGGASPRRWPGFRCASGSNHGADADGVRPGRRRDDRRRHCRGGERRRVCLAARLLMTRSFRDAMAMLSPGL